jgi:hypothetical protein
MFGGDKPPAQILDEIGMKPGRLPVNIEIDGGHEILRPDSRRKFLEYFPLQGLPMILTGFDLAPGKFPLAG